MVANTHLIFTRHSNFNIFSAYAVQTGLQLDYYNSKKEKKKSKILDLMSKDDYGT